MANGRNNKKMGSNSNAKSNGNSNGNNNGNGNSEEAAELSAEDYEIIAAALATLGNFLLFYLSSRQDKLRRKPEARLKYQKYSPFPRRNLLDGS